MENSPLPLNCVTSGEFYPVVSHAEFLRRVDEMRSNEKDITLRIPKLGSNVSFYIVDLKNLVEQEQKLTTWCYQNEGYVPCQIWGELQAMRRMRHIVIDNDERMKIMQRSVMKLKREGIPPFRLQKLKSPIPRSHQCVTHSPFPVDDFLIEVGAGKHNELRQIRGMNKKSGGGRGSTILPAHYELIMQFVERALRREKNGMVSIDPAVVRHAQYYVRHFDYDHIPEELRESVIRRHLGEIEEIGRYLSQAFSSLVTQRERQYKTINREQFNCAKFMHTIAGNPHWYLDYSDEDRKFISEQYQLLLWNAHRMSSEQLSQVCTSFQMIDVRFPGEQQALTEAIRANILGCTFFGSLDGVDSTVMRNGDGQRMLAGYAEGKIQDALQLVKTDMEIRKVFLFGKLDDICKVCDLPAGWWKKNYLRPLFTEARLRVLKEADDSVLRSLFLDMEKIRGGRTEIMSQLQITLCTPGRYGEELRTRYQRLTDSNADSAGGNA